MIITIAGMPGSGKTTVGKKLAEELQYRHISMGDLRGELAKKHGMTIDELNEVGKIEDWPHREVDELLEEYGTNEDNLVIDTWIGFHLVPNSIKLFLDCSLDIAAERIYNDQHNRVDERQYSSVGDVRTTLLQRIEATDSAFLRLYNVSFREQHRYDLIIDTSDKHPNDVADQIMVYLGSKFG